MNSNDTDYEMNRLNSKIMTIETRTGELEANNILLQMKLRIERKQRREVEDKLKQEKAELLSSLQNSNMIQNSLLEYHSNINDPSTKSIFLIKHLTDEITNLKSVIEKLKTKYSNDIGVIHHSKSITKAMKENIENLR
jgi:hypothetical protein